VSQPEELSERLRSLLLGPVDSFEKLEIVIALRASGSSGCTLAELETRTGAPVTVLARALDELTAAGLTERRGDTWSLAPGADAEAIDELVAAWSSRRVSVLAFLTQRSLERIRASAASTFADAFRFRDRKDPDRGDGDA
jgi:DNA-binding IclR family transcriptional regulator